VPNSGDDAPNGDAPNGGDDGAPAVVACDTVDEVL